jgi:hypothetical protein
MRGICAVLPMPIILGLTLALSAAGADTLEAPAEVTAQADGSFSFQYTFHKTVGTDRLAGYMWFGVENVQGGIAADCFCHAMCPVFGSGDTYTFNVSGRLTHPSLPGIVFADLALCASAGASDSTVVHSFSSPAAAPPPAAGALRFWNEPNPFSTRTTFHYGLARAGPVRLSIYDLAGRLVARLVDEVQPAGPHEASWDARVDPALRRASGVLFARLTAPGLARARPVIVVR